MMAIFGLESADIAFLGLIFGVLSAILVPLTYFFINMAKKMAILVNYVKEHEEKSSKESELLDRVVIKQAVILTRLKTIENMLFKHTGAMDLGEGSNGD